MCVRISRCAVCFSLTLLVAPAAAEEVALSGVGAQTCGQFAEAYRFAPKDIETFFFSWAQGFMSGRNLEAAIAYLPIKDLGAKPIDAQQSFIRDHCNARPLAKYTDAVIALYKSLPTAKRFERTRPP